MAQNIKYRQLKAFVILTETGSFTEAADRLAVTQPSMSVLIKGLENDLGVTLITRSTRSVVLTDIGREFYEQVKGSLEQLDNAYSAAKTSSKTRNGRIRIATLPTLAAGVVGPAIGDFRKNSPGVQIELIERTYYNFLLAMRQHEVDFGVGILRTVESELTFKLLFRDRLVIVAPNGHPITEKGTGLKSLAHHEMVMVTAGPKPQILSLLEVDLSRSLQVEHPSTAIAMVRRGLGVTVTATSALEAIDTEGLATIRVDSALAVRDVGIIMHKDKKLSPVAKRFVDDLLESRKKPLRNA